MYQRQKQTLNRLMNQNQTMYHHNKMARKHPRKKPPRKTLMAIAIACTLSFNPSAISAAWSQTEPTPPNTTSTSEPLTKAQTNPQPALVTPTNSSDQPKASSPATSSTPPLFKPVTKSTARTSWQIILPPLLSANQNQKITPAPVRLDGRIIFSIAPLTNNRTEIIEHHLKTVLQSNFEPNTLKVYYETVNGLPVIYVSWQNQPQPIYILTVTNLDAEIQGIDLETLAYQWIQEIQQALKNAELERQPEALKKQAMSAAVVIFIIILSNLTLVSMQQKLQKDHKKIEIKITPETADKETETKTNISESSENYLDSLENFSESSEAVNPLLQQRITLLQKRNFNEIQQGLVPLGQGGVLGVGTYVVLGIFPYSRWLQPIIISLLPIPLQLIFTGLSTYLAIRIGRMAIDRFFAALENRKFKSIDNSERLALRFSTFSRVLKNLSSGLLITVGIFVGLSVIGINIGPLLAGAGILGLAISLGSQNVIKDTINGFFVLLEDQYAVGDVIAVGDVGGLVENMNLRITQLRNGEGRLITIPNSSITIVQNLSKEWARVDLTLDVSYQTNIDQAFAVIQEVVDEIYNEPEWREKIIAPPELLGIDRMDHAGLMIRVWIKVKPLQHLIVGRECRRRLKTRLDQSGISIGIPQQTLFVNNALELLSLKDNN